jgi:hypothetical protein
MSDMGADPVAYEWLRLGVRAALEDNREDARYYFVQAVRTDLNFARAWLYLGGVADDPALTLSCLQKVLRLDPGETQARAGLVWAREKLGLLQPLLPLLSSVAQADLLPQPAPAAPVAPPAAPAAPPRTLLWGGLPAPTLPSMPANATPPPATQDAPAAPRAVPPPAAAPAPAAAPQDEEDSVARLLRRGVRAAVEGNRGRARYHFVKAIAVDPGNTRAWLYFGGVAEDPSTTLACMERVLRDEPDNAQARAGADWAVRRLGINAPTMRWWK